MMSSPIRHLPARILVPEPEPVVATLRAILDLRCLAQPQIPVQIRRRRRGRERPTRRILAHRHRYSPQLPDTALPNHLARQTKTPITPLPGAHLKHRLRLLDNPAQLLALIDRERQRLFAVHGLPRSTRRDRNRRMPVIRHRDHHRINVLTVEHLAIILANVRLSPNRFLAISATFRSTSHMHTTSPTGSAFSAITEPWCRKPIAPMRKRSLREKLILLRSV